MKKILVYKIYGKIYGNRKKQTELSSIKQSKITVMATNKKIKIPVAQQKRILKEYEKALAAQRAGEKLFSTPGMEQVFSKLSAKSGNTAVDKVMLNKSLRNLLIGSILQDKFPNLEIKFQFSDNSSPSTLDPFHVES